MNQLNATPAESTLSKILSAVDHTLLLQTATWDDIRQLCDDGILFGCASVCIPPRFVRAAKAYVGDQIQICTVIGFPNGYNTTAVKCFETKEALQDGADEIDMVIAIGDLKEGRLDALRDEIKAIKEICQGKVLKVIIETCLLTEEEKIAMCTVVTEAGADYIKTSTGFGKGGASKEDILLFAAHVGENVKIKAAGGISDFQDAKEMMEAGADRLGTSRLVKIMKAQDSGGSY